MHLECGNDHYDVAADISGAHFVLNKNNLVQEPRCYFSMKYFVDEMAHSVSSHREFVRGGHNGSSRCGLLSGLKNLDFLVAHRTHSLRSFSKGIDK